MEFFRLIENLNSPEFGRGFARHATQRNIEVDGRVEIDWRESEYDGERILAFFKIYDINDKLVKSGSIDYHSFPSELVNYIVFELAKHVGVYYPSNLLMVDGQMIGAGISQPNFDQQKINKYWGKIRKYL